MVAFLIFTGEVGYTDAILEDETMVGTVHILISAFQDYTLCGHATDEYDTVNYSKQPKNIKVCPGCKRVIKEIKNIRLRKEAPAQVDAEESE